MMVCGYVYRIAWSNPYTDPPDGKRILAEMYVLSDGHTGARKPADAGWRKIDKARKQLQAELNRPGQYR